MGILMLFGYIFLGVGICLTTITMFGFARFDNVYTRIHISTVNDMLGIPLAIIGTAFLFFDLGDIFTATKLCFGTAIWYIVAPITNYIIIKIVFFYKNEDDSVMRNDL